MINLDKIKSIIIIWFIIVGSITILISNSENIDAQHTPSLTIIKIEGINETITIYYSTIDGDGDKLNTTSWQYSLDGTNWYGIDESAIGNNTLKPPGFSSITWNTTMGKNNTKGMDVSNVLFKMKVTDYTQYIEIIRTFDFTGAINSPNALTFDSKGILYVYNTKDYKIYSLDVSDSSLTQLNSWQVKQKYQGLYYNCEGIMGIAWSGSNFYAVSEEVNSTTFNDKEIFKFDSNWMYVDSINHGEDVPTGITHDGSYIYICGEEHNQIERYTDYNNAGETSSLLDEIIGLAYDGTNIWSMDYDYSFHRYSSDLKSKTSFSSPLSSGDLDEITYFNGYFWGCTKSDKLYKFKIINGTSDFAESPNFKLDNNAPPKVTNISIKGESKDIKINFTLEDDENDTCNLKIMYKGGLAGNKWKPASIKETLWNFSPKKNIQLTWETNKNESGQDFNDYIINITPKDIDIGISGYSNPFNIDNNNPPEISDIRIGGNSDNIFIMFNLLDNEKDYCSLEVKYQRNSSENLWKPAAIIEPITKIKPNFNIKLTWQTKLNESGQDSNDYIINITPKDNDLGVSSYSNPFNIDNNNEPIIKNININGRSGEIKVKFDLIDIENDNCNLLVEYQGGSVKEKWELATIKEPTSEINPGINRILTWQSRFDENNFDSDNYKIRIKPSDNDEGFSNESKIFSIDNKQPIITSMGPQTTQYSQKVTLMAITNENTYCRWSLNNQDYFSIKFSNQFIIGEGTKNHYTIVTVSEGLNTFYINAIDLNGNIMKNASKISFYVNLSLDESLASPLKIIDYGPTSFQITTSVILYAITNKNAYVRWSKVNQKYENMPNSNGFTTGEGKKYHLIKINASEGENVYYISAKEVDDSSISNTITVPFTVNLSALDNEPPSVIYFYPTHSDVPINSHFIIVFNEEMDPDSLPPSAFLKNLGIDGICDWNLTKMEFIPKEKENLNYGTLYIIDTINNAKDKNGNSLNQPKQWTFRTEKGIKKDNEFIMNTEYISIIIGIIMIILTIIIIYIMIKQKNKKIIQGRPQSIPPTKPKEGNKTHFPRKKLKSISQRITKNKNEDVLKKIMNSKKK